MRPHRIERRRSGLRHLHPPTPQQNERRMRAALEEIVAVIDDVETRCLLSDQDVTPTLQEMTEKELGQIYRAAMRGLRCEK